MSEKLVYSPTLTRAFLRAIAKHDDHDLEQVRQDIDLRRGVIGSAECVDVEVRTDDSGEVTMLIDPHRVRPHRDHTHATAAFLDEHHAWDADGVWLPAE